MIFAVVMVFGVVEQDVADGALDAAESVGELLLARSLPVVCLIWCSRLRAGSLRRTVMALRGVSAGFLPALGRLPPWVGFMVQESPPWLVAGWEG